MLPGGGIGTAVLHVSEVPLGQSAHQLDVPDNNNKYYLLLLENLEARLDNEGFIGIKNAKLQY